MEEPTCPATPPLAKCPDTPPRAGCSKSSPGRWGGSTDNNDKSRTPTPNRPSSPENCSICLGPLANKSFTNSCCHQFCFVCLLEWSKVKAECPLCKVGFDSIIHNVRSQDDYDQYHVRQAAPRAPVVRTGMFWTTSRTVHYQYRAFTEWMARGGISGYRALDSLVLHEAIPSGSSEAGSYSVQARRNPTGTSEFRRSIYDRDLWARLQPDVTGRYRECSPEFYRHNPAQVHRLIPFLNRELNVLLDNGSRTVYVMEKILELLPLHSITSPMFRSQVARLIGHQHAPHFCHELRAFASSPYDLIGYDRAVQYHPSGGAGLSIEVEDAESSDVEVHAADDDDDDIQIIETTHAARNPPPAASTSATATSSSFQDLAALSSVSVVNVPSSSESEDAEDVQIVGFVKPRHERTPELITLSSPEHSHSSYLFNPVHDQSLPGIRSLSPDSLVCIDLGHRSSAEHKWQEHFSDESSDGSPFAYNPRIQFGSHRSSQQGSRKDRETGSSSESSWLEDYARKGKSSKRSKDNKKHTKSKSSKHSKTHVVSSDSEDESQPSTSKGRPRKKKRKTYKSSRNTSDRAASPLRKRQACSNSDYASPRSTIRSAIVSPNSHQTVPVGEEEMPPSCSSGPKICNIVMKRATTEEGIDSWRLASSNISPESHRSSRTRSEEHSSSSHHTSKSPSHYKHSSPSQSKKHRSSRTSVHSRRKKSSQSERESRSVHKDKHRRKHQGRSRSRSKSRSRSRSREKPSKSLKNKSRPLSFSDESDS